MSKTPTITILLLLVVTAAVTYGALHKYQAYKVTPPKPVNYQALYVNADKQVKSLTASNGTLQAEVTELNTEKAHFCSELSQHKLADALCQ